MRDLPVEDVIRLVLATNQLERKVLNENTVLVYPNTPAKQREYQELVVKSFYLANADVKQTANMIRAAGQDARHVHRREAQPAGDQGHARARCASPSA